MKLTPDHVRDFLTYYTERVSYLTIDLGVAYPSEATRRIIREEAETNCEGNEDGRDLVEEGLWDPWTPIQQFKERYGSCELHKLTPFLYSQIPIRFIGALPSEDSNAALASPIHHLEPGASAPVI